MRFSSQGVITGLELGPSDGELGLDDYEQDEGDNIIPGTGILDIEERAWPLICTFDDFATMLESSLK